MLMLELITHFTVRANPGIILNIILVLVPKRKTFPFTPS